MTEDDERMSAADLIDMMIKAHEVVKANHTIIFVNRTDYDYLILNGYFKKDDPQVIIIEPMREVDLSEIFDKIEPMKMPEKFEMQGSQCGKRSAWSQRPEGYRRCKQNQKFNKRSR